MKKETDTITIKISDLRQLADRCINAGVEVSCIGTFIKTYIDCKKPPEPEIKPVKAGNMISPHPAAWGGAAVL